MNCRVSLALTFLAVLTAGTLRTERTSAVVIVDETFDGYADDSAMHSVWGGLPGNPSGTISEVEGQFELVSLVADNPDFNGNSTVDAPDYVAWRDNLGLTGTATPSQGDANGDMNVDAADYDAWKKAYGSTPSGGGTGQALRHLTNFSDEAQRVPDGNLEYLQPLDPNFEHDFSIYPSDGLDPIVLRGDIYADTPALQRNTIALRSFFDGTHANLIEMGFYNGGGSQPGNADAGAAVEGSDGQNKGFAGFGARLQLFDATPGPNPDWQFFAFDPSWDSDGNGLVTEAEVFDALGGAGWHRFELTISADPETDGHDFEFTLDLLRDGLNNATGEEGVDATMTFNDLIAVTNAGFNSLRLGGPSGNYTTQAAMFDNIFLSAPVVEAGAASAAVPEPGTWMLAALALAGLLKGVRPMRGIGRILSFSSRS